MLRRHLIAGAAGAAALGLPGLVQAQEFPRAGMTVKYIVPFPPGGLTDVMARTFRES